MAQDMIDHRGLDQFLGNVDRYPELAAIVEAILSRVRYFSVPNGTRLQTKIMGNAACFGVDYQGLRYIEQNPATKSDEARRARAGAKIVWVIRTYNTITGAPLTKHLWVGKVEDGMVRMR